MDTYENSGEKVVGMLANKSHMIECRHVNLDLYDIAYDLALVLRGHDYGLFVLLRP